MKSWQFIMVGLFIGMLVAAALFLVASPPRGTSVTLLPAPSPAPIVVQVDGEVQNPGVYHLSRESRVQQAIQAAGGLRSAANKEAINLAAKLKDGDKLLVPALGTPVAPPPYASNQGSDTQLLAESTPIGPVNLNTATFEELQTLPGIGATRAQQIIDYRQQHGSFKTIEELDNVEGIGPAILDKLRQFITVN
jgi:competence protein ComEA